MREAALDLFAEYGFAGTSMRDISRKADTSTANIYNYTSSKENLLLEIMRTTMKELLAIYDVSSVEHTCPVARFVYVVHEHVRYHAEHPREAKIGNTQLGLLSEIGRYEILDMREEYENRLRDIIQEAHDAGEFQEPDIKYATFAILEMGISVSQWFRPQGPLAPTQVASIYCRFALRLVHYSQEAHDAVCTREHTRRGQPGWEIISRDDNHIGRLSGTIQEG